MSRKTKIIFLTAGLILVAIFGIYKLARMFASGSYPFAEIYELNYSEDKVIKAVEQFKIQHSDMIAPKVTIENKGSYDLKDSEGRTGNSYWYKIYFYYPKENQIIFTWTRPNGNGKTSFAFVSVNNGLDIGHWKEINDDFGFVENRRIKKDFEEGILKPIEKILTNEK